jgi:putative oxidoreductase
MSVTRAIARPLLAAVFVAGGVDTLRNPAAKVPAADRVVGGLVERTPQLSETEQVVKIDAAVKVVAGTMLAFGKFPRLSSLALTASLIPTTVAGHRFWEESDPGKRAAQRLHLLKNAGILGGLILASVDTEGRPSLAWRARRAPAAAKHVADDLRREAELELHSVRGRTRSARKELRRRHQPSIHSIADNVREAAVGLRSDLQPAVESAAQAVRDAAAEWPQQIEPAFHTAATTVRDRFRPI